MSRVSRLPKLSTSSDRPCFSLMPCTPLAKPPGTRSHELRARSCGRRRWPLYSLRNGPEGANASSPDAPANAPRRLIFHTLQFFSGPRGLSRHVQRRCFRHRCPRHGSIPLGDAEYCSSQATRREKDTYAYWGAVPSRHIQRCSSDARSRAAQDVERVILSIPLSTPAHVATKVTYHEE